MKRHPYLYTGVLVLSVVVFLFLFSLQTGYVITTNNKLIPVDAPDFFRKHQTEVANTSMLGIRFVGDIMLARNVENLMSTYGVMYPFTALPLQPEYVYLVGNFESAIPQKHVHTPSMGFSFSTKKENLELLQRYGFTHMGIANNHSYDFGAAAYLHTTQTLQEAKLQPFGDQRNQASSTIQFVTVGNDIVALVGIFAVDSGPTLDEIDTLVSRASKQSTIQVAYVHFGTEYALVHNSFQKRLAQQFIDAGMDIVIGHHPHVVQDIEVYKGRLIFYSLGNFLFDQYFSQDVQEGLMVEMSMTDDVLSFNLLPVTSIGSRSVPRLMEQYEKDTFLTQLAKKSDTELATMIKAGKIEVPK
jgi:poly-gamma-glutamate synthesis protein (capsule biosynthesis protein)